MHTMIPYNSKQISAAKMNKGKEVDLICIMRVH